MTWAATVRASEGQVVLRVVRGLPSVEMAPEVARTLAATLLVVAEQAEDTGKGHEKASDG